MAIRHLLTAYLAATTAVCLADPVDWVNVDYVLKHGKGSADTSNAQNAIASRAGSTAQDGPWTIATKGIKPPSGDSRDYLSWAPYHWPACNWCSKGSTHFARPNSTADDPDDGFEDAPADDDAGQPYEETPYQPASFEDLRSEKVSVNFLVDLHNSPRRMKRLHRSKFYHDSSTKEKRDLMDSQDAVLAPAEILPSIGLPEAPVSTASPPTPTMPQPGVGLPRSSTSTNRVAGTQAPAQAPAKTQKGKTNCTPSPTKSLAPSATWTTCPYEVRDGKVNPDTSLLNGRDAAQSMSQSVFSNAISYALKKSGGNSQNVVQAIDAFFLSSSTGMNPNVNYGQLVRGPGKRVGSYTGILDLRGFVKVVNAVQLMRNTKSPDWTAAREQAFTNWMKAYINWLQTSDLGESVTTKANNHLSFYVSQLAAIKILFGDTKGAASVLQSYFSKQFQDQIAQSGEQPFEAARTRPFHYRCFNLEAMITNAKLGDQLGLNFWTTKSKYGATIQTALDYTMSVGPKGEDVDDIIPHVAAVAAAYGDPKGKYAAYLQKNAPSYKSQPYWFYDQSGALPNSPAGKRTKRSDFGDDTIPAIRAQPATSASNSTMQDGSDSPDDVSDGPTPLAAGTVPFECPEVFRNVTSVELEDGLFVTCDDLRPFFEIPPVPTDM